MVLKADAGALRWHGDALGGAEAALGTEPVYSPALGPGATWHDADSAGAQWLQSTHCLSPCMPNSTLAS